MNKNHKKTRIIVPLSNIGAAVVVVSNESTISEKTFESFIKNNSFFRTVINKVSEYTGCKYNLMQIKGFRQIVKFKYFRTS